MAQAFSASLDSAFSLDSDVTQLSQNVDQKYVCSYSLGDSMAVGLTTLLTPLLQETADDHSEPRIGSPAAEDP